MKKVCQYLLVVGVFVLIWAVIIICIPACTYTVKKSEADVYVENRYGSIIDKVELEGALIYLFQSEEQRDLIALNKNLWFPDKCKVHSEIKSGILTVSNNYGYFQVIDSEGKIKILQEGLEKTYTRSFLSIFLLAFSSANIYWYKRKGHQKQLP